MKIESTSFLKSAAKPDQFPKGNLPEVGFIGRSNVGKSSLINSLLGVKGLARTSSTPGRTQQINFFLINETFRFVDLPGYGYARVPEKIRREWGHLAESYLANRPCLVLFILITDLRHEPTRLDLQMKKWLVESGKPFVIVATKSDKLSGNELRVSLTRASAAFGGMEVMPYSAVTRNGAERIWKEILKRLSQASEHSNR
ncbi:MAG TPA: ribosome biogenesis GTP-binding protein YihA/YsxC [Blastocatellia bacterium]|nr:ribosome biogenesis GTP-binding protein YihA/YsxC [Blastocatellia bacterium]